MVIFVFLQMFCDQNVSSFLQLHTNYFKICESLIYETLLEEYRVFSSIMISCIGKHPSNE